MLLIPVRIGALRTSRKRFYTQCPQGKAQARISAVWKNARLAAFLCGERCCAAAIIPRCAGRRAVGGAGRRPGQVRQVFPAQVLKAQHMSSRLAVGCASFVSCIAVT